MPQRLEYPNDITGSTQDVKGSDGRMNVSARADSRSYYNSRDRGQTYSLVFNDDDVAANDFIVWWQNSSSTLQLVISELEISTENTGVFKLHFVTGTATGGSALTPANLNASSPNDAAANARGNGALSVIASSAEIEIIRLDALDHQSIDLKDRVRLGQNDAIALEVDASAGGDVEGTIYGFYE